MAVATGQIERMHYRRRSSFIQEQRGERRETFEPLEEVEVDVVDVTPKRRNSRTKSASVCVATLASESTRAIDGSYDFPRPTTHQCGGRSRFIVERSCYPEALDAVELQTIRSLGHYEDANPAYFSVVACSKGHFVTKIVHGMEWLAAHSLAYRKKQWSLEAYLEKRKHTLCAWTFGIVAVTSMAIIIILQSSGKLG